MSVRQEGCPETLGWLRRNTYFLLGASLWSVVVGASLGVNLRLDQRSMVDLALAQARVACQAHTLRGASSNVGGETLRTLAFEMEKAGKAGDLNSVAAHMDDLEREFVRLKEAMGEEFRT